MDRRMSCRSLPLDCEEHLKMNSKGCGRKQFRTNLRSKSAFTWYHWGIPREIFQYSLSPCRGLNPGSPEAGMLTTRQRRSVISDRILVVRCITNHCIEKNHDPVQWYTTEIISDSFAHMAGTANLSCRNSAVSAMRALMQHLSTAN
jgi:hypothetical protein